MSDSVRGTRIRQWLKEAEPGQSIQYFRGFLALGVDASGLPLTEPERQAAVRTADQLFRAAQRQLVHLVQRREGPMNWTYVAIARSSRTVRRRPDTSPHMEMHDVEV
jgi:hypothetical protein